LASSKVLWLSDLCLGKSHTASNSLSLPLGLFGCREGSYNPGLRIFRKCFGMSYPGRELKRGLDCGLRTDKLLQLTFIEWLRQQQLARESSSLRDKGFSCLKSHPVKILSI